MCGYDQTYPQILETRPSRTGPPLTETLRLLAPLAPTLETLNLGGNKLGGTITDDITAFTKLTELGLDSMGLEGAWYDQPETYRARKRIEKRIARAGTLQMMPPSLKELNMYNAGKFTGGIPSEWGSRTNLKSLDMRNCGLDGASLRV